MGRVMRWAAGMVVGAFVMTGAGCTDEPTQPTDLPDTATSAATSSSAGGTEEEQAVVEAYKGFWTELIALGDVDPEEVQETIAPYTTSPLLEQVDQVIANFRKNGLKPAGSVQFSNIAVDLTGDTATINECRDASTELVIDAANGQTVSSGEPRSAISTTAVRQADGLWKISDYTLTVGGC